MAEKNSYQLTLPYALENATQDSLFGVLGDSVSAVAENMLETVNTAMEKAGIKIYPDLEKIKFLTNHIMDSHMNRSCTFPYKPNVETNANDLLRVLFTLEGHQFLCPHVILQALDHKHFSSFNSYFSENFLYTMKEVIDGQKDAFEVVRSFSEDVQSYAFDLSKKVLVPVNKKSLISKSEKYMKSAISILKLFGYEQFAPGMRTVDPDLFDEYTQDIESILPLIEERIDTPNGSDPLLLTHLIAHNPNYVTPDFSVFANSSPVVADVMKDYEKLSTSIEKISSLLFFSDRGELFDPVLAFLEKKLSPNFGDIDTLYAFSSLKKIESYELNGKGKQSSFIWVPIFVPHIKLDAWREDTIRNPVVAFEDATKLIDSTEKRISAVNTQLDKIKMNSQMINIIRTIGTKTGEDIVSNLVEVESTDLDSYVKEKIRQYTRFKKVKERFDPFEFRIQAKELRSLAKVKRELEKRLENAQEEFGYWREFVTVPDKLVELPYSRRI